MSISKCSCGNTKFKRVTQSVENCNIHIDFIQCSECNTVIGILENLNNEAQLQKIEARLQNIESKIKR
ncbi:MULTISPECIES: hypothetical protein [Acinetobacter]|uniref:hypothetical protein n=1 Tax=Acinetobacter TaxID=469 RepID=UPI001F1AA6CB|nr:MULTISPECIES: hypothetical protein [Acinetobacter]MDV2483314.1 hypothetical protein [Acinetobacter towneri]UIZ56320.1 hypothetical protein LZP46_07735 [Acinetobacter sp. SCLZS86]